MCLAKEANDGAVSLFGSLETRVSAGLAGDETIRTMNEANRQQNALAIGQDNSISHHHHSAHGRSAQSRQLVGVLRWARALNVLLSVVYLWALISSIDHEQLGHFWTQARTLNFQNFQSRGLGFKHRPPPPPPPPQQPTKCWSVRNQAGISSSTMEFGVNFARSPTTPTGAIEGDIHYGATSYSPACSSSKKSSSSSSTIAEQISGSATSRTTNKPRLPSLTRDRGSDDSGPRQIAANVRYYLLIVTLVDIVANRDWRKLKRALAGAMQSGEGQFGPALEANPSLTGMPSEACRGSSTRATLARLVGSISSLLLSSPKHLFQITQVALLMMFPLHFESPLGSLVSLMSPLNTLNQMVRFALDTYQAHCYLKLARDHNELAERELDQRQNHNPPRDNNNNNSTGADLANSSGFSSKPLGLKRYLLISQIVHLKMTILALLIQLDLKPCVHSLELLVIIVCLVQTLSVMFATFNEFHTIHLRQSTQDDLDEDNKLKVDR